MGLKWVKCPIAIDVELIMNRMLIAIDVKLIIVGFVSIK